jgi:enoyl-CoA hydratase/carnithine racemase
MLYIGPRSVRNAKQMYYRGLSMYRHDGMPFADALDANLIGMEDTVEGPRAFVERRKPVYKNK